MFIINSINAVITAARVRLSVFLFKLMHGTVGSQLSVPGRVDVRVCVPVVV